MNARLDHIEEVLSGYFLGAPRARRDVAADLAMLTDVAVHHLGVVDHAGVTLVQDGEVIRCLAATDAHPLVLDNIQRGCGQGPSFDAAAGQSVFRVDDLTTEQRWPSFTLKALAGTPVRALLCLPLFRDGTTHASLNLFADRPHVLDADTEAAGSLIGAHIAERLTAGRGVRPVASPRTDAINQAKTLLMHRFGIDVAQSYAVLVKLAKQQSESIEAVARQLVAGQTTDATPRGAGGRAESDWQ